MQQSEIAALHDLKCGSLYIRTKKTISDYPTFLKKQSVRTQVLLETPASRGPFFLGIRTFLMQA
ncbi:hypothetical protein [Methanosarcina sp.]|uniref:hypothetical protein n=1 Tax=Methanosarcina sp. TaxID=2213 RepID=UPI003BB6428D